MQGRYPQPIRSAEHYRHRAAQLKDAAARAAGPADRETLLSLAEQYERYEQMATKREPSIKAPAAQMTEHLSPR